MSLILALFFQDGQIDKLIEDLGHENSAVREKATTALMKIGKKALPALKKAERCSDTETALRASVVLADIELNRLLEPVLKPYPSITLKAEGMQYKDVLAAITQQSGVKFDGSVNQNKTVITESWNNEPFIKVMDRLSTLANNTWLYGDEAVTISSAPREYEPSCYADGFKISVARVDVYRSRDFTGGYHGLLWIYLGASTDPGVKCLHGPSFNITSLIDANDNSIEVDSTIKTSTPNSSRLVKYGSEPFTVNHLNQDTKRIKLIRGVASFVFPIDTEDVVINFGGEENVTEFGDFTIQTTNLGSSIQFLFTKVGDPRILDYIDKASIDLLDGDTSKHTENRFDMMAEDSFRLTLDLGEHEEALWIGTLKFKLNKKLHTKTVPFEFTNIEVP